MRKTITMFLLLFSSVVLSQEAEVKEKIKVNDGVQKGTLIYDGTKYVQDGIWKSDYAKAEYDMGKLVWYHPKNNRKWTKDEIVIAQLKSKIKRLESSLVLNSNE